MRGVFPDGAGRLRGVVTVGLLALAAPASGQTPDSVPAPSLPAPPPTGGWAAWAALPHPWSTVVGITVVLPAGSANDPEGLDGTAWLLGRASAEAIRSRLGERTVRVEAEVDRNRTVYRVISVPGAWTRAYRTLQDVLFDEPETPVRGLEEARASLLSVHAFEAGAPVREFDREMYRMLGGVGRPWARDPRGDPETLERVTAGALDDLRRRTYRREEAVVSLTGALAPREVESLVTGEVGGADETDGIRVAAGSVAPPPSGLAWAEGGRTHQVRDVTSGWIAAAWPLDPSTPRTVAEMLADRVRGELVSEPPPPGLFSAEVALEDLPEGHVALLVRLAVLPESIGTWETRALQTVADLRDRPLESGFFRFHRRQFRNRRLVEDAAPEREGERAALDLRRAGEPRDLAAEIWRMDSASLHEASRALGPVRLLVFGPDLADDDASGRRSAGAGTSRSDGNPESAGGRP